MDHRTQNFHIFHFMLVWAWNRYNDNVFMKKLIIAKYIGMSRLQQPYLLEVCIIWEDDICEDEDIIWEDDDSAAIASNLALASLLDCLVCFSLAKNFPTIAFCLSSLSLLSLKNLMKVGAKYFGLRSLEKILDFYKNSKSQNTGLT